MVHWQYNEQSVWAVSLCGFWAVDLGVLQRCRHIKQVRSASVLLLCILDRDGPTVRLPFRSEAQTAYSRLTLEVVACV